MGTNLVVLLEKGIFKLNDYSIEIYQELRRAGNPVKETQKNLRDQRRPEVPKINLAGKGP